MQEKVLTILGPEISLSAWQLPTPHLWRKLLKIENPESGHHAPCSVSPDPAQQAGQDLASWGWRNTRAKEDNPWANTTHSLWLQFLKHHPNLHDCCGLKVSSPYQPFFAQQSFVLIFSDPSTATEPPSFHGCWLHPRYILPWTARAVQCHGIAVLRKSPQLSEVPFCSYFFSLFLQLFFPKPIFFPAHT